MSDKSKRLADRASIAKPLREAAANPPQRFPARCSSCQRSDGEVDCLVEFGDRLVCGDCSDALADTVAEIRGRR